MHLQYLSDLFLSVGKGVGNKYKFNEIFMSEMLLAVILRTSQRSAATWFIIELIFVCMHNYSVYCFMYYYPAAVVLIKVCFEYTIL